MIGKIIGGSIGLLAGIGISTPLMVDNIGPTQKYPGAVFSTIWLTSTVVGASIGHVIETKSQ